MKVTLSYLGRSGLRGGSLQLMPNLAREAVAFDAPLEHPLRFREAISALHDVVISDLRYKPRDKMAYVQWKRSEQERMNALRREEYEHAKDEILAWRGDVPRDLEKTYNACLRRYWSVRQKYANYLMKHDQDLWRMLMPCDPVITVADDVVFFECFSADESSYGCLSVDRDGGMGRSQDVRLGTTNVDYSWELYNHFQTLRTYRQTRLQVDPSGFEVAVEDQPDYREEKIDLPPGWLRGFMQIQGAMGLPMRRVTLAREAVYSLLAWLKRHKAKASPRAIRFELLPGAAPSLVLEPWEQRIASAGTRYDGPGGEPIRIWGRRRLLVLARLLPLAERFDVYLLGTGLPSFWVAQMGEMRLTVGLSGWTTNDWTRGSSLDLLAPPAVPTAALVNRVSDFLHSRRAATLDEVNRQCLASAAECAAALNHLAHTGQVIYDLPAAVYRWRQVMPRALGEAELGPENPEAKAAREIVARRKVRIASRDEAPGGGTLLAGNSGGVEVELLIDADGGIKRGSCRCSHHFRFGIRKGPCRHLLAMRQAALQTGGGGEEDTNNWYERLTRWARN